MRGPTGAPITQSLFIDHQYDASNAIYTWADEDKVVKGVVYPSLKRLYLEEEDPTEYLFATKYLLNWKHWVRLNTKNQMLKAHFEEWREELEIKLRSLAILSILEQSVDGAKGFQAAKWIADKGWDKRSPGRPSKEEIDKEDAIKQRIEDEFVRDVDRMGKH